MIYLDSIAESSPETKSSSIQSKSSVFSLVVFLVLTVFSVILLDSIAESSPETKSSRPGGPFSFESMFTDSEILTDSSDSTIR